LLGFLVCKGRMVELTDFFGRLTHRRTHLSQWRKWLRSKGMLSIADLPGVPAMDCLYGAAPGSNLHTNGVKHCLACPVDEGEFPASTLFAYIWCDLHLRYMLQYST
jgi:hypothetical protein